ncbi:hypothetical protein CEXT_206861 [Caerostris extrusa]|uniref:Uncharacterized protein n=1 Tax=Caerostris extrusa TaxID=172846 RepID=A0AAV4R590_CAEEX|nr:hypothetical protein CEXT_206861 [Caerostris extrusa]
MGQRPIDMLNCWSTASSGSNGTLRDVPARPSQPSTFRRSIISGTRFPNRSSPVMRASPPPSSADPPPRDKLGSLDGNDIYEGEHLFWRSCCAGFFFVRFNSGRDFLSCCRNWDTAIEPDYVWVVSSMVVIAWDIGW